MGPDSLGEGGEGSAGLNRPDDGHKLAETLERENMATKDAKILPDLAAFEAMKKRNEELEAALEAEKARKPGGFGLEISDKGCVVIRLGGGFPISLYLDKLDVLLGNVDQLKAYVETNRNRIKRNKGA